MPLILKKEKKVKKILLLVVLMTTVFILAVSAQRRFQVGERVEIRVAGEVKPGVIVEGYRDTEFGYGTYKVHLDGEKYCNNHALDSLSDAKFVFAEEKKNTAEIKAPVNNRNNTYAAGRNSANKFWAGQKFKNGERVMYSEGYIIWSGPGEIIEIDAEKRFYTVRDIKDRSWRYSYPCFAVFKTNQLDNDFYIGKWDVRITGATSSFAHNGKSYRQFSGGAQVPPLEVKADGTYTWRLSARQVIRGRWDERDGVPGITLLNAIDGKDFTLYEKTEASVPTAKTRDEIGITQLESNTGHFMAYRIGANKSCALINRNF